MKPHVFWIDCKARCDDSNKTLIRKYLEKHPGSGDGELYLWIERWPKEEGDGFIFIGQVAI
jgi:hypothetical protein